MKSRARTDLDRGCLHYTIRGERDTRKERQPWIAGRTNGRCDHLSGWICLDWWLSSGEHTECRSSRLCSPFLDWRGSLEMRYPVKQKKWQCVRQVRYQIWIFFNIWGRQYLEIIWHANFLKMSCTCLKKGTTVLDKFDVNLDFFYFLNIWGQQYLEIIRQHANVLENVLHLSENRYDSVRKVRYQIWIFFNIWGRQYLEIIRHAKFF